MDSSLKHTVIDERTVEYGIDTGTGSHSGSEARQAWRHHGEHLRGGARRTVFPLPFNAKSRSMLPSLSALDCAPRPSAGATMARRSGEWPLPSRRDDLRGRAFDSRPSTGTAHLQACLPEVREDTRTQSQKHDVAAKDIRKNAALQNQKTQELRQE